ncbi:T9SS type A sorting domain-containing protein [candidate division KSB1 bacterium]|nr:T9SS type A sorting domain-containing protein [candidate division KSB1 bacterium]
MMMPENKFHKHAKFIAEVLLAIIIIGILAQQKLTESSTQKINSISPNRNLNHSLLFSSSHDIVSFKSMNDRPVLPDSFISETQRFMIHYTTEGKDAVAVEDLNGNAVPDRVEKIALAFEQSYAVEIESLNYNLPPSFEGGAKPYQIYITDLSVNYAITVVENRDSTVSAQKQVSSYILFDNDFEGPGYHLQGDDAIKVIAAHEFFHAIQLGYVFRKIDGFFFELSAVWMEDQVFDEVDNYLYYLDYFFADPDVPLNAVSYTIPNIFKHIYGACIFAFYIEENFGADAIREIWQRMPDESALEATNNIFKKHHSDFESEYVKFSIWNFFTGSRFRPGFSYHDGATYPESKIQSDSLIDYFAQKNGAGYFLTSRYHIFHPVEDANYSATLLTSIPEHWRLGVIVFDDKKIDTYVANAGAALALKNVQKGQTIVAIPCNVDRFANPALVYFKETPETYQLLLNREIKPPTIPMKSFQIVKIYPNPFSNAVTFSIKKNEEAPLTIRIFNLQGQQVDQIEVGELLLELNDVTWRLNETQRSLPTGIYFCQFKAGKFSETVKIYLSR